jgi:hypothetical protein
MKIKSRINHEIRLLTLNRVLWRKDVIMSLVNYEHEKRL